MKPVARERSYRVRLNEKELQTLQRIMGHGASTYGEAIKHAIHEYDRLSEGIVIPNPEDYERWLKALRERYGGKG